MVVIMDDEAREQVYAQPLAALTPHTITDPKKLRDEIGRIRTRGYSIDDQEVVMGVYCVAVPILDRLGRSAGAISVTGPSVKKPGPDVEPIVAMLRDACQHVSHRLGYAGPWPGATEPGRRAG